MVMAGNQTPSPGTPMMMPDPASSLRDLERLLDVPCAGWKGDFAGRGVELDCDGVAVGQAALREALAGGGTHHDVLGRLGRLAGTAKVSARRRPAVLAVVDIARQATRRPLAMAVFGFGSAASSTAA